MIALEWHCTGRFWRSDVGSPERKCDPEWGEDVRWSKHGTLGKARQRRSTTRHFVTVEEASVSWIRTVFHPVFFQKTNRWAASAYWRNLHISEAHLNIRHSISVDGSWRISFGCLLLLRMTSTSEDISVRTAKKKQTYSHFAMKNEQLVELEGRTKMKTYWKNTFAIEEIAPHPRRLRGHHSELGRQEEPEVIRNSEKEKRWHFQVLSGFTGIIIHRCGGCT